MLLEMDRDKRIEKLKKLADLKDIHIQVMYYRCFDKSVPEITDILNIENESTISARFTTIFKALGVSGEKALVKEYCPIFFEFIKKENDWENWAIIRVEILRQLWELQSKSGPKVSPEPSPPLVSSMTNPEADSEQPASESQIESSPNPSSLPGSNEASSDAEGKQPGPEPSTPSPRQRESPRMPPWIFVAIPLLILCVACVTFVPWGWGIVGPVIRNTIAQFQATQRPTDATEPSRPATETPEPTQIPASLPTDGMLITPTSTITPEPTFTITAEPTQNPTPLPASTILFEDSFDAANDIWQISEGDISIANGHLVPLGTIEAGFIERLLGDPSWDNYSVKVTVKAGSCWGDQNNAIGVYAQDEKNLVAFGFGACVRNLFEVDNSNWNKIPEVGWIIPGEFGTFEIEITAKGGEINVYTNGVNKINYFSPSKRNGMVYIKLSKKSVLEDIKITKLP